MMQKKKSMKTFSSQTGIWNALSWSLVFFHAAILKIDLSRKESEVQKPSE